MSAGSRRTLAAALACVLLVSAQGRCWAGSPAEELLRVVRGADLAAARVLLEGHADPNRALADGSSPLAWAVDSQNRDMVALLLSHGARPTASDTALSPLLIGCERGDPQILQLLLDAGADATIARPDGITALAICAGSTPTSIVERLLAAGAVADEADATGQTPLMWAAAHGRVDNMRLLLAHGARIDAATRKGFTPLFFALKSGEPLAPRALLEAGADPGYVAPDGTTVVQMAVYQKNYEFAALLIARGVDLQARDRNGNQLLHAAVLAHQPALVKLLLQHGADANALTGPSQVTWRYEVNFTSAKYFVPPKSPLLLAAELGAAELMTTLLDAGASPTFRAADGTNIVLAAATSGSLPALQLALQLAPDPNVTNAEGLTPLHRLLGCEVVADTRAMLQLLADKGARLDIRSVDGRTPVDLTKDAPAGVKELFQTVFDARRQRDTRSAAR